MCKAFSYDYEMVADAFFKWIVVQNRGISVDLHPPCREQLVVQIKKYYPDEEALNEEVTRVIREQARKAAKASN